MINLVDYLTDAVTLQLDDDGQQAGEEIALRGDAGGVVVDACDEVVGVLTISDCLRALISTEYYQVPALRQPVSALMTRAPDVISTEDTVGQVIEKLLSRSRSILPVVDKRRRYVGVLCRGGLYRAYLAALHEGRPAGVPVWLQRDSLSRLRSSRLGPTALTAWLTPRPR